MLRMYLQCSSYVLTAPRAFYRHMRLSGKVEKYQIFGNILPLVVGSLGSWYPRDDDIKSFLGTSNFRSGTAAKSVKTREKTIKETLEIINLSEV